jgi:hypothetical protein
MELSFLQPMVVRRPFIQGKADLYLIKNNCYTRMSLLVDPVLKGR